ncbi:origin recognition complex subunit 2-domain-containing protein [Glomus cerebriforme]|uniref:Origin recognition complex subunit 2 n=1 Tax=Glomus cerebriforme TaxID=658196 RepID=A0A397T175_9GLOM|nr:origin recognition complex subunit 2-domain-containing protein [Glomus cerebriforme]
MLKKIPNELRFLLDSNGANGASSISSSEGNTTIAERIIQRRRGSRTDTKRIESITNFVASEQETLRKSQIIEKEPQFAQDEQETITEESEDEDMQVGEEKLDVVATLLATFKHRKAPQMKLENTVGRLANLKNLKPVSGGSAPFSNVSRKIKVSSDQSQPVPVVERDILTGSERFFEDNAQKRKFKVKKMSNNIASLHNDKTTFSFITEKHGEELNELESSVSRHFIQWEFQINRNKNILLYGFGSKEHILERYQDFYNKNENITWIHFYGNDDLSTLDSIYLMLLENLFGSKRVFSNFDLIRKAELIRDYFKVTAAKPIFKIIIHDIDGSLFENREARVALILLSDIPNVHLLATSEKINFSSVWSLIEEDKMNWHAHEVTSFKNYKLPMENKKKIERSCQNFKLEKNEVKSVLMSFNTHRRDMFYVFANHIIESKRKGHTNWNSINLNTFFNYCNKNLICRERKNFDLYLENYYRQGIFIPNKTRSGEIGITTPMPLHDIRAMLLDKEIFGYLNN